jgi:glycoprotein endo-alpha-1,2-mannosidase
MLAKKRTKTQFPVLVTTFNEWHEGANIEPAKPMTVSPYTFEGRNINEYVYKDYDGAWGYTGVQAQFAYIDKTREFANIYMEL